MEHKAIHDRDLKQEDRENPNHSRPLFSSFFLPSLAAVNAFLEALSFLKFLSSAWRAQLGFSLLAGIAILGLLWGYHGFVDSCRGQIPP